MSVRIVELTPELERDWTRYVSSHPSSTLFHTLIWRDAVEDAFGHRSRYLTAWRDDRLVGIFPMAQVKSHFAGTILVSVPYAVYGGTLADDPSAHQGLLEAAVALTERTRAQWLDIRSIEPQWPDLAVAKRYVTFRKRLPDDPDRVLSELPRKARAAARQARDRYGLTARFDDVHLDLVWSLYSKSMRRLASPNYPARFFRALMERTAPASAGRNEIRHVVQVIEHDHRPIAGLISFIFRDTLMPYFAGCDERFEKYHPNNFMYLSAMEMGVRMGCREFDFGRSRIDNTGSYNFKRFQGFEPTPLHYQYYVPQNGRVPDLAPDNGRLALGRMVWPHLPLTLTRPLGSWLSRSIPG
jgi:FemAB-related protein (PEP-CTERM system-associated)